MKKILIALLFSVFSLSSFAQESGTTALGLGLGLEYGGIGGRFITYPSKNVGVFGGVGSAIAGLGYNVGLQVKFDSDKRATGFLEAMYGYNGVIIVEGLTSANKIYYGPSIGAGINLATRNDTGNFWHFSILIPIRSSEFNDAWDALQNNPGIETNVLLPFTFSIGYNFKL